MRGERGLRVVAQRGDTRRIPVTMYTNQEDCVRQQLFGLGPSKDRLKGTGGFRDQVDARVSR